MPEFTKTGAAAQPGGRSCGILEIALQQHGTLVGTGDHPGVAAEPSTGDIGSVGLQGGLAPVQLLLGHLQGDGGCRDVDGDGIAFLHQGKLLFCQEKDRLLETYGLFVGTRQQAEALAEDAVLAREDSGFGGVRAIVRRDAVPACLPLEKPTVEDIILAMVRKEQKR